MSERGDFEPQGYVAVCRFCGRVAEGTASFALEHYRACVAPREEAKRIFGNEQHALLRLASDRSQPQ
ncbi:hypothetical protein [Labilithrix luteola]|uniref:hypothetical protein n=1 Tax=Labilithrix luteola TaxID=1391654 RepID=UPI0011BA63F9|nr:hypothetical protein [Labilithrix luteola]